MAREAGELLLTPRVSAGLIRGGRAGARNNKEESDCGGLKNRYKMVIVGYLFSKDNVRFSGWSWLTDNWY